jgi:hypothetical protein
LILGALTAVVTITALTYILQKTTTAEPVCP